MAIDFRVDDRFANSTKEGFYGAWPQVNVANASQIKAVARPRHRGASAYRFVVNPGDVPAGVTNGEMGMGRWVGSREDLFEGTWRWYAWSTWFPNEQVPSNFRIVHEWHAQSNLFAQAPIKLDSTNGAGLERLTIRFNAGEQTGPGGGTAWEHNQRYTILPAIVHNVRYDFVVGVLWARTATGALRFYLRNHAADEPFQLFRLSNIATLVWTQAAGVGQMFMTQGLYTSAETYQRSIVHDNLRRGATRDDVLADFFRVSIARRVVDLSQVSL